MSNAAKLWIAVAVVVVVALIAWFTFKPNSPFAVDPSDHLSSWSLPLPQDAASTSPITEANIAKLQSYVGTSTYAASDIYLGIANDYILLGNGKAAYHYYDKAIEASSSEAVAYYDLGALFASLHATSTALKAYVQAVDLAPSTSFYQLAYIDYLALTEPNSASTEAAFDAAGQMLGSTTPNYLMSRAAWLGSIGSTTAAIAAWEAVLPQVDLAQQSAVNEQIARLKQ